MEEWIVYVLFIAWIAVVIVSAAIGWIPVVGWIITWALNVILLVFWIIGIVYSLSGEQKNIPFVGDLAKNF